MNIIKTKQGWIVHVPDEVVVALGLVDGQRVTLRAVPRPENEVRHWMHELRGRLPDYPFDRWDWTPTAKPPA